MLKEIKFIGKGSFKKMMGDVQQMTKAKVKAKVVTGPPCPLTQKYVQMIIASKKWTWNDIQKGLTRVEKRQIKNRADAILPVVPVDPITRFPTFPKKSIIATLTLPQSLYMSTDDVQFRQLDNQMKIKHPNFKRRNFKGKQYSWHHHQKPGKMQLVEYGIHNRTSHKGGRTRWSLGPRK
jgi:hypothetical protein